MPTQKVSSSLAEHLPSWDWSICRLFSNYASKGTITVLASLILPNSLKIFMRVVLPMSYAHSLLNSVKCLRQRSSPMKLRWFISMICGLMKVKIIRTSFLLTTSFRILKATCQFLLAWGACQGTEQNLRHYVHFNQLIWPGWKQLCLLCGLSTLFICAKCCQIVPSRRWYSKLKLFVYWNRMELRFIIPVPMSMTLLALLL